MELELKPEFYDNFIGYRKTEIDKLLLNLSKKELKQLIRFWGINSFKKIGPAAKKLISKLKKELNKVEIKLKQEFYDNFPNYGINVVDLLIKSLSEKELKKLIKYYEINSNQKIGIVAKRLISKLKKELNKKYKMDIYKKYSYCLSKKELNKALSFLSLKEIETLKKEYTFEEKVELKESLTEREKKHIAQIIIKLEKSINEYFPNKKVKEFKADYKSFFLLFPGYTKEEILLVVNHLNEKDYKLLIKKYGSDLTNTKHVDDLTYQEEQDINTRIIYNIRRALKRIREGENYYCISTLLNTDINLIKERVHKLSIKERKILFRLFGENLDKEVLINPKQINRIISKVVVQKLTSSSKRSKPKKITPFYKRLIMCKRENETAEDFIKRVNLCISSKHLIILTKKYGSDLLNFIENENCTVEENEIITKIIIPTIKSRLRVLENKTLKEYLPYFVTMEDIYEGIVELDIKEREKLYFEFGENLDQRRYFVDYREENNLKTMNIIKKLENIIYKNINKRMHIRTTTRESIKVLKNIKSLTQCEEFEFLLSLYPFNVSIAIIIKLNIEDFDNRQISLLTGVEENKITELTLSYLDEQSFLLQNNKRNLFKKTK